MPELDVAEAEGMGRADTILVSVPPPDGVLLAAFLREQGFAVNEAPLHALEARALVEAPRVMIVDVDPPGAVDAIERARETSATELICVGDAMRAAELGASRRNGRAFERPLDVEALVVSLLALAGPASVPEVEGTLPPDAESRSPRETAQPPPQHAGSERPRGSEYPSPSDPVEMAALLPPIDEPEGAAVLVPIEVSPELSRILDSAERRVNAQGPPRSGVPSPEEELDLLLPPDLLASLDEPLDPEDGESMSGRTGQARPRTTAAGAAPGSPSRPATSPGIGALSGSAPPSREPEPTFAMLLEPASRLPHPGRVGGVPVPAASPSDRPLSVQQGEGSTTGELEGGPGHDGGGAPGPAGRPTTVPAPFLSTDRSLEGNGDHGVEGGDDRLEASGAPALSREAAELPVEAPIVHARDAAGPDVPIPVVLGEGDAVRALAAAIAARASGSIALGVEAATRRIVLHEGDIVTAASSAPDETLVAFLAARGDLERDVAARLANKLPGHGRHAGAALIAHGHLGQDDLWPVLRAHAEWLIGRALLAEDGTGVMEAEPPGRLKAEPNVFGGATGAEVLLEQIRRVVPPELARRRLGGPTARLAEGPHRPLLVECALREGDEHIVRTAAGRSVGEVLADGEPEMADVLYGLVSLGVLETLAPTAPVENAPSALDPLDEEALRQRVRARLALVEDGDYFALLGVPRSATSYEIRRAYLELRRAFEPARVLTAATTDLAGDVRLVAEVIDEAYEILREPHRRERYRRAIEAGPP